MKNFKLKRLLGLAFVGCLSTLSVSTVFAAAGTTIGNTAILTYDVGGTPATTSGSASFVEDRVVNFTVVESDTATTSVVAGALAQVQTFTVTNFGNGTQDFLLTAIDAGNGVISGVHGGADVTDAVTTANISVFVETDGIPGYLAGSGNDDAIFIDELVPLGFVTVYIVSDIPGTATSGQVAVMSLVAQVADNTGGSGTEGEAIMNDNNGNFSPDGEFSNTGTTTAEDAAQAATDNIADTATEEIVFNDPAGDLGSDGATDDAQDGQASDYDSYTVGVAVLTVTKTSEVIWDSVNGGLTSAAGTNPKAIPTAYVQYTITIANDALASVSGFLTSLEDSLLAAGTSLDPNLLKSSAGTTIVPGDYESAALDAIRINTSNTGVGNGTGRTPAGVIYCTGDPIASDTDGCSYDASVITVNLATVASMDAEAGYLAGELKPGESVDIVFNVILP